MTQRQEPTDLYHLNPSRRKIPFPLCRRGFTFGNGNPTPKSPTNLSVNGSMSQLGTTIAHQHSLESLLQQSTVQQHLQLLDENRYLQKQLKELRQVNKSLLVKLEEKENELVRTDCQYRELILKVNSQLEQTSSQIRNFSIDEGKSVLRPRTDFQHSRFEQTTTNRSSRSKYEESDTYQRSRSKENLLKLKQVFEEMDFKPVERLAKSKSTKRQRRH